MSPYKLLIHRLKSSILGILMYTTLSGWIPPGPTMEGERLTHFPSFTSWNRLFDIQHEFQIVMTKLLTPLIYSLLPTLNTTLTLQLHHLVLLTTVLYLSPLLWHLPLPSLLPNADYGTLSVLSGPIWVLFLQTFLGWIFASVPAVLTWLLFK